MNPLNFEAKSEPIHVQTRSESSQDYLQKPHTQEQNTDNDAVDSETIPCVQPYKTLVDPSASLPTPPPMHREHSGSISQQRKVLGARRISPAVAPGHQLGDCEESDEGEGTVSELNAKLDRLNSEIESTKDDLGKEDEEFQSNQSALYASKNDLNQAVTDKEGASKALKKQVADLSGQNSLAQGRRAATEKQLQQKYQDRQRLRDDIQKWDKEIIALRAQAQRLDSDKINYRAEANEAITMLRKEYADESVANKVLEDALRDTRSKIKELENEKDRLDQDEPEQLSGPKSFTQLEDGEWTQKLQVLQFNYHSAFQKLEQARIYHQQAEHTLNEWKQRRVSQPHLFLSAPVLDLDPRRRGSNRRSRTLSLRNEVSPQGPTFDLSSAPAYSSTMANISPAFSMQSPFFNMMNGASVLSDHLTGMTAAEMELARQLALPLLAHFSRQAFYTMMSRVGWTI